MDVTIVEYFQNIYVGSNGETQFGFIDKYKYKAIKNCKNIPNQQQRLTEESNQIWNILCPMEKDQIQHAYNTFFGIIKHENNINKLEQNTHRKKTQPIITISTENKKATAIRTELSRNMASSTLIKYQKTADEMVDYYPSYYTYGVITDIILYMHNRAIECNLYDEYTTRFYDLFTHVFFMGGCFVERFFEDKEFRDHIIINNKYPNFDISRIC